MVAIASPVARAKAREPRKQVERSEQVVEAVKARQRKRAQKSASRGGKARVAGDADKPKFGRLRMHGPRKVVVQDGDERCGLAEKKGRRTVQLNALLACGAADFEEAPGREDFDEGEEGAEDHEARFNEYVDREFDDAGAEVRSLDQRDRKVGLFGDWLETSGHGKYVQWVKDEETALYTLEVVREPNGARHGNSKARDECMSE